MTHRDSYRSQAYGSYVPEDVVRLRGLTMIIL